MKGSRLLLCLAFAALGACGANDSTGPAPRSPMSPAAAAFNADGAWHDGLLVPGSRGNAGTAPAPGDQKHLTCAIDTALHGTATIGSQGGILYVGRNMLIVPAGALTQTVRMSGTVDAGNSFKITFEPHGLQFKKPAGLVLDATSCDSAPNIVYLDEQGGIAERITAIFSNWWHRVAAPLDHFSVYMLDV